jgi:two-component system phosphate regulon sensor histidine kinase PhoR
MTPVVAFEFKRFICAVVVGLGLGWLFGYVAAGLAAALAVLLLLQYRGAWRMHQEIQGADARGARERGILGDIESRLTRLQYQARKRKRRLGKIAKRYQQAAEANPDGSIIIDRDGSIEWLNRAAARLLALRQGQDHGQPIVNFIRNPGFSEWLEDDQAEQTLELDSPSESSPRLLLRVVPYGGSKRILMVRDITRLHQLEQMRRDFVANVSHELRSPLTVVVGYLESMADDKRLPEAFSRPVELMANQSERMTRIVEDLLRLSRIESDPQAAAHHPVNMADLTDALLRDAERIGSGQHVIEHHVERSLLLLGDYNEIYSALSNLVFNAVQYTPKGGTITLKWLPDEEEKGARFEVQDTGEGIDAHHLPRLTERFYRVGKARSRELGGTGLGLAIVKHVLMRHDAHLQVSSELGKGSVFASVFPASRVCRELGSIQLSQETDGHEAVAVATGSEQPRDDRRKDDDWARQTP